MFFIFPPLIQAGLLAGKFVQVYSSSGMPLSMVRDAVTGRIIGHAIGTTLTPLITTPNFLMNVWNVHQNVKILDVTTKTAQSVQALAQSVGILQASTAIIGIGVAATAALAAVNLYQTLKLRQEVAELRLEIKEGFIDLKQMLSNQGSQLIEHIDRVAEDVEFRAHRTILTQAYSQFFQGSVRLQSALTIQDPARRDADITSARDMMFDALADYKNPQILENVNAAADIRRRECVWAIQQAIALTYQIQGEYVAASHCLQELGRTIRQDSLRAIDVISSQAELDFLFPEITRIHQHDLVAVELWQAHIDWAQALPAEEMKLLNSTQLEQLELPTPQGTISTPLEQLLYEELRVTSSNASLRAQMRMMMAPNLRSDYELVIRDRSHTKGLKSLTADNLKMTSDAAIANLYNYLQPA